MRIYNIIYNHFILKDEKVLYISSEGNLEDKGRKLFTGKQLTIIKLIDSSLLLLWNDDEKVLYDIKKEKVTQIDKNLTPITNTYDTSTKYAHKIVDDKTFLCVFDIETFQSKSLLKINKPISFIIRGLFYSIQNNFQTIVCLDINNSIQWSQNLSSFFNTSEKVVIYKGQVYIFDSKIFLFAYCSNWNVFSTLVLDSQTGNIIYRTQEIGGSLYQYEEKIHCKLLDGIGILDCNTLLVSKISLSSYLHDENLVLFENPMSFYNNFAYITAKKQDSNINSIWLVIDLETNAVIHKEEVLQDFKKKSEEGNRTFINNIQANDNLIAINTTGGILYVYEREEIKFIS